MSKQEQLVLAEFFEEIVEAEMAQDRVKQELAGSKDFDVSKLFSSISENSKIITPKLLSAYLQPKLRVSPNELYMIFCKFDHQLQGEIDLNSFKKQLHPFRKPSKGQKHPTDSKMLFLNLIQQWLDKERLLNVCRRDLQGIIQYQMFDIIAVQQKGYIGRREMRLFLERNEMKGEQRFIDYLFLGLRRRSYFKVTLECFCENLNPLEFGWNGSYKKQVEEEESKELKRRGEEEERKMREIKEHEQKVENQARKQRRRQEAESQKQREIEEELKREAEKAREESEKLLRKAVLEAEKLERMEIEKQKLMLEEEVRENELQRQRLEELKILNQHQKSEGRYLEERIIRNQVDLSSAKRQIRQEKLHLYEADRVNDINRENVQVGLRRDRCLSDIYSQRINYLERDAEVERIRRETAIALAQRQHQPHLFLNLEDRTHIYRPQSTYSPYTHYNPVPASYNNSFNTTSKLRNSTYDKHHSLMKDTYSPIRNIDEKSRVDKLRTPSEVRNHQLERSRGDLEIKSRRLEDEIRTATGRKHPYV